MSKSSKNDPFKGDFVTFTPLNKWDNKLARQKLDEIFEQAILVADTKISWYIAHGNQKGWASKIVRLIAIFCFIVSTLIPYISLIIGNEITIGTKKIGETLQLSTSNHASGLLYVGYLLAGIGGGILLFDKYYGFSNSWARFVLTRIDLENMRNSFVENWQALYFDNSPLTPIGFGIMLNALLKFQEGFNKTIRTETEAWAREFQQSLQELAAAIKVQGDNFKADIEKQRQDSADLASARNAQSADFSRVPEVEQFQLLKEMIERCRDGWENSVKNYTGVSIGRKTTGEDLTVIDPGTFCLQFNVTKKEKDIGSDQINTVPPYYMWLGYKIPTDVLETGEISSAVFTGAELPLPKPLGVSIGRQNIDSAGTLGLRVELSDGELYGISCYHVIFPEELRTGTYKVEKNQTDKVLPPEYIISPAKIDGTQPNLLGMVSHGIFNKYMDCAFFKTTTSDIDKSIYQLSLATEIHDLKFSDEKTLPIKFCGRSSGVVLSGKVFTISNAPTIKYFPGTQSEKAFKFSDMVLLQVDCAQGDSGSVVLTEDNKLLAMIFAVGSGFAWAIPMRGIYNNFTFKVK